MSRPPADAREDERGRRRFRSDAAHPTAGPDHHDDAPQDGHDDEEMPGLQVSRRQLVVGAVIVAAFVGFLYVVLPQLGGVEDDIKRIRDADPWWMVLALTFSVLSFAGYVVVFKGVYVPEDDRIARRLGAAESYQITMASLAATRLFAAGGAGGVALTAWALRRAGMGPRTVADRTIGFIVLTYAVYLLGLVVAAAGLYYGIFPGPRPFAITALPALLATGALVLAFTTALLPADVERRVRGWASGHGRFARLMGRLATVPAAVSTGVRIALWHLRRFPDMAVLGALAYWGFNIAILWACFHAFGQAPPVAVVVTAYFVGLLGNLLPLPGGVGGVDGGMIGALAAFSVDFGLATVAVLAYRLLAFWLPTLPGAIAYLQLRRTVARWRLERRGAPAAAVGTAAP